MNKDYVGSDFDDFLREEGIFEEVEAAALKKVAGYLTEQQAMDILLSPAAQAEMLQESEQVSADLEVVLLHKKSGIR